MAALVCPGPPGAPRGAAAGWCRRAKASGISIRVEFAELLAAHRRGILAGYNFTISAGPLEGANNRIKTMRRQDYGFRDRDLFMLKIIYALHESCCEPVA